MDFSDANESHVWFDVLYQGSQEYYDFHDSLDACDRPPMTPPDDLPDGPPDVPPDDPPFKGKTI